MDESPFDLSRSAFTRKSRYFPECGVSWSGLEHFIAFHLQLDDAATDCYISGGEEIGLSRCERRLSMVRVLVILNSVSTASVFFI